MFFGCGRPLAVLALLLCSLGTAEADPPSEADLRFFESKIRPLLIEHCTDCHSADAAQAELQLDSLAGMLTGGLSGPAVVPGQAEESLLVAAVSYADEALQMPPDEKLPDAQIELLKQWIARGAPHPESDGVEMPAVRRAAFDVDEARQFWSLQPIRRPPVPPVDDTVWVRSPIDAFVLAELEAAGLTPTAPADRRSLIRRATYDLTGLPPTPQQIDHFLADDSPGAFARVVDRLLQSKAYGEHWGRHWLDIARYADSNGLDENVAHGNAWRYRDYVIRSLNHDKPLDQFIVEQLAGDLLAAAAGHPSTQQAGDDDLTAVDPQTAELLVATGFLALGPKVLAEADQAKMRMDIIDEQVDTIGRALLGLTLGCARCHDHKFDPVSAADYYALAGILGSTRTMESLKTIAKWTENPIASPQDLRRRDEALQRVADQRQRIERLVRQATERLQAEKAESKEAESDQAADPSDDSSKDAAEPTPEELEAQFPEQTREQLKRLRKQLDELEAAVPEVPTAMGVHDEAEISDMRLHVRGSHLTLGATVPRGLPAVLKPNDGLQLPADQSGRLELARWIVGPDNPLTPRVMANRLWRWHFGRGLVESTDNFGMLGQRPTNPALLDWLASELPRVGWSLKAMHRQLMLSSTYQMGSQADAGNLAIDPDNQLGWRAELRRLQAESIRDAVLASSDMLDPAMGGSLLHVGNREFIFNHTSKDDTSYDARRRSVYLPVIRNNLYDGFSLFDYNAADVVQGDRQSSTVAPQALYLLNSELLIEAADSLARQLVEWPGDDAGRVEQLFLRTLSRYPETQETERVLEFLDRFTSGGTAAASPADELRHDAWTAACQAMLVCNEFIYVP